MTIDEILSKETFIDLFKLSEVEQLEKENKLFAEAKKLGITRQFTSSLKKYKDLYGGKKIRFNGELDLNERKYNIYR